MKRKDFIKSVLGIGLLLPFFKKKKEPILTHEDFSDGVIDTDKWEVVKSPYVGISYDQGKTWEIEEL